jgi:hypothetical protein
MSAGPKPLTTIYTAFEIASAQVEVDKAFNNALDRHDSTRRNPFTGTDWAPGLDPIEPQKEMGLRAVLARRWFRRNCEPGVPQLPLGYFEREEMKKGGLQHVVAHYASSLETLEYDVTLHPRFRVYACGVMANGVPYDSIHNDSFMQKHYPPRKLVGLDGNFLWAPPMLPSARGRK